jgi:prepilin-type N-terminal cleavage/methylation domain-containing protein
MKDSSRRNHWSDAMMKLRTLTGEAFGTRAGGFTLIEVMIALVILSVALLGLASLTVITAKTNSYGSHLTEASVFAQDKLEELRATRWEDITEGIDSDQVSGSTGIDYTRRWGVNRNENLKMITISINWKDRIDHSIELISVVCQ